MARITIDPLTRLEGHGKVEIFLDEKGEVENAYLQVPELRGFERFCVGRPAEEMPRITTSICGLCPEAHHMASVKALDELFGAAPPPAARMIRELVYASFFVLDHATHFFALGGPDILLDRDTPAGGRTFAAVLHRLGPALAKSVVATRARNLDLIRMLGGRGVHLVAGLPGGWSQPVGEAGRKAAAEAARANVAFSLSSLDLFESTVQKDGPLLEAIRSESYTARTHSLGTVDASGRPNFYDGTMRVVDPDGRHVLDFAARDYLSHVAERVEPWSTMKVPYLRTPGWTGYAEGRESGVYSSTPLARLNVATRMATPRAEEARERMFATLGSAGSGGARRPLHLVLANHWARLVEMLYASERMLELSREPELTDPRVRRPVATRGGVGTGSVEAPRGALVHHYEADERGIITRVNLVVGTTQNHASIALSIRKAATGLVRAGVAVTEGVLNRIEMAIRSYDPCLSCATHALPGRMPLEVTVRDAAGEVVSRGTRGSVPPVPPAP